MNTIKLLIVVIFSCCSYFFYCSHTKPRDTTPTVLEGVWKKTTPITGCSVPVVYIDVSVRFQGKKYLVIRNSFTCEGKDGTRLLIRAFTNRGKFEVRNDSLVMYRSKYPTEYFSFSIVEDTLIVKGKEKDFIFRRVKDIEAQYYPDVDDITVDEETELIFFE